MFYKLINMLYAFGRRFSVSSLREPLGSWQSPVFRYEIPTVAMPPRNDALGIGAHGRYAPSE